jgi:TonB-linked SusC/RagA family outer membrane protein
MRKTASLVLLLAISAIVLAQTKTITGSVLDETGDPVPYATITMNGAGKATAANANGQFKTELSNGASLTISAAGYESQTITPATLNIRVILKASGTQTLEKVIVTGVAGATSKNKMTVSVTKVSAADLNAVPPTSLSSALTGKVAGLKTSTFGGLPGESVDVQLRADNNLNVSSSPLIIVDGIITSGSLADINPDDVESMEIVKGAAASALYGSRAGNGVISVITKRGKGPAGRTAVTVRNEFGFQRLSHNLETARSHPYKLAADWEQFKGRYTKYDGVTYPADYVAAGWSPDVSGNRQIDADHYMDNPYGVTFNQQDEFFRTGNNYTNFVSIANQSESSNVYASFENNAQQGVLALTDGYNRQNFRLNYDQKLSGWLRFSMSNLLIIRNVQFPGSTNAGTVLGAANAGGVFYNIARQEKDVNLSLPNADGQPYYRRSNQFNSEATNPMYDLYKIKRKERSNRWLGNYSFNVKFSRSIDLDIYHSVELENYNYKNVTPKDYWKVAADGYTNGGMSIANSKTNNQNTQATLNLNKQFGELTARAKLSYLYENRKYSYDYVSASEFKISGIEELNNFTTINSASSREETERAQNYFAILGLDYHSRYLLDGMFRYDGSSLFGSDARWNPYYRVSGAYRISQDLPIRGIDELKIRAARGTAGIRPGFDWQYEVYRLSNGVTTASQKGNNLLKPSKTTETEIGLNINFLKKFSFEATYARSITKDQFLNVPLIPFLNEGFNNQWRNAGTIRSNTLEMTLGANWIKKQDFSWKTNIVFSRIRQRITELPIPPYVYSNADLGDQYMFYVKQGETYGAIYGYRFVRSLDEMSKQLPSGKTIKDYEVNSDGYVVPAGSQGKTTEKPVRLQENGKDWYGKIGDGNADFNMGITNTFTYKGFTFYVLLDWKQGGDIYNGREQRLAFNLVSKRMDMTDVPQAQKKTYDYWSGGLYDANNANAYWVERGTYLKIREVAIGYSLNKTLLNRLTGNAVKGANIRVLGRNLATFTSYTGYDPEVGSIRVPYDGIFASPIYRNLSFSLTLDF